MATNLVNLDALIARADLADADADTSGAPKTATIRVTDLKEDAFFYRSLRKPDFQRETANWSPKKIAELVKTFLNHELVPAIILWESGPNVFVIDGAHRLSALISWVQDDYGDGLRSRKFFENFVPLEQERAAQQTRSLIQKAVGKYSDHEIAMTHPGTSPPELVDRALRLGSMVMELQWVRAPNAEKAAASFFKINQEATPIDKTELQILKARRTSKAIAARAIVRNGRGHQYWSHFSKDTCDAIRSDAEQIYKLLFSPPLEQPIKTLDLPFAGRGYGSNALPLIFDLVGIATEDGSGKSKKAADGENLPEDEDGSQTLLDLKKVKRLMERVTGTSPASLGLHPALYVYGRSGNHQPTAFLGLISFIKNIELSGRLRLFTERRGKFEAFLLENRGIISAVVHKLGSGGRSIPKLVDLYNRILELVETEPNAEAVFSKLGEVREFSFLAILLQADDQSEVDDQGTDFSRNAKSAVFLKSALGTPVLCPICEGLMHKNSMTVDHIERKAEGGQGIPSNGQMTHPYCNSTIKG